MRGAMTFHLIVSILATAFFEQVTTSLVRVTISYRAIELGLSVVWLGIITAAFAILPMIFAVSVGRFIDRGNDARTAWIGGILQVTACAGLALWHSLAGLLVFTAVLGIGHLMLVISQQVLCTRHGGPGVIDRMLANYMVANALGQGVGPYIVGWAGGSASIPPTQLLFWIGVGAAACSCASCFMLRPASPPAARVEGSKPVPVRDILRFPGLRAIFFISVVTVAAQDLVVVYLPILGAERGMAVDVVGMLLATRAVASMVSRFIFARLNEWMGRWPLMFASTVGSGISYLGIAAPLPLPMMFVVIAAAGCALGIAVTASISSVLALVTPDVRGTTNSLRMMGNRIGQFTIPVVAGLIAAASGAGSIFLVLGLSLVGAGAAIRLRRNA
ncbi:MAG: hypothetical protein QOC56_917 [Alphaproteobacteria bacterium]|jgi:MFS family permease|nr:hypothetical protein [Alphaproteobacteria bacterium]